MDKKARHKLYKASVYPGWWPILDEYVPKILEADPEAEVYIKEKYGYLRIAISSKKIPLQQQIEWETAAEQASSAVCEFCGAPGKHRPNRAWMQTLCDRCHRGNTATKQKATREAEQRWLETKDDEEINLIGQKLVNKHIAALRALAEGEKPKEG